MEEKLAIKQSGAWFWHSNLTRAEVVSRLEQCQISRDWLVCPQSSADRAVTVGQLVDDPAVFQRQTQEAAANDKHCRAIADAVEKPTLLKMGEKLIQLFFMCLVIGGATVKIFFPHMLGVGFTPTTLAILIPIWSIGGLGLIAWVVGRVQHRHLVRAAVRRELSLANRSA